MRKVPARSESIEIPGMTEIEQKIVDKVKEIGKIQQVSRFACQMQECESYRDLLTETGTGLDDIAKAKLTNNDIKTEKTKKGLSADHVCREAASEVKRIKRCAGVASAPAIAKTYMDLSLDGKKGRMDFSQDTKKLFDFVELLSNYCNAISIMERRSGS